MRVIDTQISDVKIIEPEIFKDDRGFFYESFNQSKFETALGRKVTFVQDNHSKSSKGVLRGIHYQIQQPQGKLVRVIHGEVFDVAVDLRKNSPTFRRWAAARLSASNNHQLWVPEGFGHAFLVLSDEAEFLYKTTDYYSPKFERAIIWNDKDLAIDWPEEINLQPILSNKDKAALFLSDAELYE